MAENILTAEQESKLRQPIDDYVGAKIGRASWRERVF